MLLCFKTGNVPGNSLERGFKIRDDFCRHVLGREFCDETDFERLSPEVLSPNNVRAYMLYDLNMSTRSLDLKQIPLVCIRVTYEAGKA